MHQHKKDVCWQELKNVYDPDIVLAQEACDPQDTDHVIWHKLTDYCGTAIYSKSGIHKELIVKDCEGWLVGAEVTWQSLPSGNGESLTIFNFHAQAKSKMGNGYANGIIGALERIKSTFTPKNLVIGGDFNLLPVDNESTIPGRIKREQKVFDLLRNDFHLESAWTLAHQDEKPPQTLRWRSKPEPLFHCDFLFVPQAWRTHIAACDVLSSAQWDKLSDHNPVVATFN